MREGTTSISSWVLVIATALELRGVDIPDLFKRAGLDPNALRDPDARYPTKGISELWRLAVEATADPAIGLKVALHTQPTTFHALGFSLAASSTLLEAFERLARSLRLVTDSSRLDISCNEREVKLEVINQPGAEPAPEGIDAFMAVCVRMARGLVGRDLDPLEVRMCRVAPQDVTSFKRLFRVTPAFEAESNVLVFDARRCSELLPTRNAELAHVNEAVVARHLAELDAVDLHTQVHRYLVDALPRGESSQEAVAHKLGLSLRSLQRRLSDQGTSYSRILDEVRKELALSFIEDPRHTLGEIAYLLGFADQSNFTRSFKRWHGVSPSEHRVRKHIVQRPASRPIDDRKA